MRLFLRSLNSSSLKVWPCGPLWTEYSGEFLRHSSSRAMAYRVGIFVERASVSTGSHMENTFESRTSVGLPCPSWHVQKHYLSDGCGISFDPPARNTKTLHGHTDGQWWILGKWGTWVEFSSFPTTLLGKLWGKLLVFSPLIPDCHPSALAKGIWPNCSVGFCVWTTCLMNVFPFTEPCY